MPDTIAAISTAQGEAGIAIIRMSGPDSVLIAEKILKIPKSLAPFKFKNFNERAMCLAALFLDEELVDYVLSVYFKSPASFTGEDMVEIHTHGGTLIARLCLEELLKNGARPAEPGEFTKRAFLNNKIDLSQAESVLGIISAKSEQALKSAARTLSGELSQSLRALHEKILNIQGDIEIGLDFPEGEAPLINNFELLNNINEIKAELSDLTRRCAAGILLREGADVVISGRPNVGKSSLLNALLKRKRAIVTDIPGTTRDIIEESILLRGVPVRLIDTAGLRDTSDKIETDGIELAKDAIDNANLILWLMDASKSLDEQDIFYLKNFLNLNNIIIALNKSDIEPNILSADDVKKFFINKKIFNVINISAKTGKGLEELKDLIINLIIKDGAPDAGLNVSARQLDELRLCGKSLSEIKDAVELNAGEVIIADLLSAARLSLERVLGISSDEILLNSIFSRFCVGK